MDWEILLYLCFCFLWLVFSAIFVWVVLITELSYLPGTKISFIYNLCAPLYSWKWSSKAYESPEIQERLFLEPLKNVLADNPSAKVLDLACGNGRLSRKLIEAEWFKGSILAVDASKSMLKNLEQFLNEKDKFSRVTLQKADLESWLPETHEMFDVVILTEAGEFLRDYPLVLKGVSEKLKPQGLFLTTKPPDWLAYLSFGRKQDSKNLIKLFQFNDFDEIRIFSWTERYEVVHAKWKVN
jgi:ubiquinone/menaquinone biosynthesis C-methylase UbiE